MARLCVLGSNSGRNAGDAAILSSIIRNIGRLRPDTIFEVPVPNPANLYRRFDRARVRAVNMMPWSLSLRLLGLPTLLSIRRCDTVLITDGIIFDVKLFNPLFNFLILLIFLVPWARLCGKRVVCFLVGIGPLHSRIGRRMARFVCNRCDAIMVRETDSQALLEEIGIDPARIEVYADAAFLDEPAEPNRVATIFDENGLNDGKPVIGLNVNAYFDRWIRDERGREIDRDVFVEALAHGIDKTLAQLDCRIAMVLTQVMDVPFAHRVLERVNRRNAVAVLGNDRYSPEELMGAMGRMHLFVGMRVHSLILAAAMDTPCVGLAYAPKVRHFMRLVGTPEHTIELPTLTGDRFAETVTRAFEARAQLRATLAARMQEIKAAAMRGFETLAESLPPHAE